MLLLHERQHFGKSVDNPYLLDQTVLDSKFISTFLIEQVELLFKRLSVLADV